MLLLLYSWAICLKQKSGICMQFPLGTSVSFWWQSVLFPFLLPVTPAAGPRCQTQECIFFPAVLSDSVVGTSARGCSEAACVQLPKFKMQTVLFYLYAKTFSVALIMGTEYYIFISYTNTQIPLFMILVSWQLLHFCNQKLGGKKKASKSANETSKVVAYFQ